ncbi:MAG: iron-sulfur cluster assembly scaffold protein [Candidatus Cloacimonetes bacterium]|nr:iron-sulfur cluster assembly scaffold protein [Candidatus Cloacimonadota bacterium]MCF7812949.1 iron-sulfur cluster assembly scaffold protein [Candidatus Cloacimonadota bacterium]MCF7867160.1 iron-sulfur cluster assembly scaffold protein [Candidatus Cloacimonadota bacterium]MCF7882520.1 iron-sulfur cluster assembly scaffold protein [Candidatus Cloacimonadota bacterium]
MQYSQKVLDHFMKPHNIGKIENPDAEATEGSPACGDQVSIQLKVNPETQIIEDIKFQSYGCASNIATGSIITDMAKGRTLAEAKEITWKEAADELDGLPPVKMHCSVLAVDTLRKAIKDYEVKHKLSEADKFNKDTIVEELKKVIYPKVGEDIVSLKMVKYAGFEDGVAIIDLEIPKFDKYRDNVAEEIQEHLEKFKEIKDIKITM